MKSWLLAFRPKTLTAALVPILVGTSLAIANHLYWSPWVVVFTLLSSFFIQIATNLFNDALDFKKGADREDRKGPVRVTQTGLLSERMVMYMAFGALALAFLTGIPLVYRGGWVIVAIGLVSLLLAYAYTGGPYPLAYKGLGDVFVILFFGVIAVSGVFYLHTLQFSWGAVIAGLQVGFWATVLLAINNLRDVEEDKKSNKRTLAVRFGQKFTVAEIALLILGSFVFSFYWLEHSLVWAGILPLLLVPMSWQLFSQIQKSEPSLIYNSFLAKAATIHLLFGLQLAVGLILHL